MQIITDCMLKWDRKKQISKGRGTLGKVLAFSAADEEQGRKTLHRHWQIWVEEIDQNLRNCLFHEDTEMRNTAINLFCKHINSVITASYGQELCITHKCTMNTTNNIVTGDHNTHHNSIEEHDARSFRRARHKELCAKIEGKILSCSTCGQNLSPSDIVHESLNKLHEYLIPGDRGKDNRLDNILPLSKERMDIAAYTYSYHMKHGCATENDKFWGNARTHNISFESHLQQTYVIHHWGDDM
jgi:hypothetical protein